MAVDDDRRSRSFARLAEVIGRDEAVTIFEMLPPQGTDLATRADLGTLDRRFEQVDQRFEQVDQRFEQVDQRFEQVDRRFEQVDQRFERIDHRLDRIETALHDLRGEVLTAVAGQTRSLVLGVLTATVSIGGLSALLAQL
jgi:uncharacterized protein (DUF3084 family)